MKVAPKTEFLTISAGIGGFLVREKGSKGNGHGVPVLKSLLCFLLNGGKMTDYSIYKKHIKK